MSGTDGPGETFARDLERGRDENAPRLSNVSAGDGIGSALSSTNSSIMGDDIQGDMGEEWGPQHPCYPHLNPHVAVDSAEHATTRIIRVRRDWLLHGDLAPAFSNLYPEILDPAGISEPEFRKVIGTLNAALGEAFNPYAGRNVVDSVIGAVTGWLWDDLGMTAAKRKLAGLETWIEQWNTEMQKSMATEDSGLVAPKIISLRQTGYMTVSTAARLLHHSLICTDSRY